MVEGDAEGCVEGEGEDWAGGCDFRVGLVCAQAGEIPSPSATTTATIAKIACMARSFQTVDYRHVVCPKMIARRSAMPISEGKIAKLESNADNVTFLTHPHLRALRAYPSIRQQNAHEKSRPPDLGSEDTDKQPLVENRSKDAACRRQEEEHYQLKFSTVHHRTTSWQVMRPWKTASRTAIDRLSDRPLCRGRRAQPQRCVRVHDENERPGGGQPTGACSV